MEESDDQATSFAVGTLSLEYLESLYRSYAGTDYAVTSQLRWTFNTEPRSPREAEASNRNTIALGDPGASSPGSAVKPQGRASRRNLKASNVGQQSIRLSEREKSCLSWTALGKSSWEIGQILSISENTVIFHIKNAMKKLGVSSRTLAALKAVQLRLIEPTIGGESPPRR